eukprot:scaffold4099_cov53-Attheya_sp.AAC.4
MDGGYCRLLLVRYMQQHTQECALAVVAIGCVELVVESSRSASIMVARSRLSSHRRRNMYVHYGPISIA